MIGGSGVGLILDKLICAGIVGVKNGAVVICDLRASVIDTSTDTINTHSLSRIDSMSCGR